MDRYYNLRYRQVVDVVSMIYKNSIADVREQTSFFTEIEYFFDTTKHYIYEENAK